MQPNEERTSLNFALNILSITLYSKSLLDSFSASGIPFQIRSSDFGIQSDLVLHDHDL